MSLAKAVGAFVDVMSQAIATTARSYKPGVDLAVRVLQKEMAQHRDYDDPERIGLEHVLGYATGYQQDLRRRIEAGEGKHDQAE